MRSTLSHTQKNTTTHTVSVTAVECGLDIEEGMDMGEGENVDEESVLVSGVNPKHHLALLPLSTRAGANDS